MGNLCCAVGYVLRYTLGYVLPRFIPYSGYMYMIEEDLASIEDSSDVLENSFPNGDELDTVESQNVEKDNEETSVNNFSLLFDIMTDFFRNYNFQTNALSGKVFERNLKNAKHTFQNFKSDPFVRKQLKWNFRHKDLVPGLEQIKIENTNNNPEREENADSRYIYDQNQECNTQEQGEIESLVKEHVTVKSNKSSSRDRRRKYGTVQKRGTLAQRGKFQQSFSNCRSLVERKNSTNQITDDSRHRLAGGHKLRRLSLPNLHSVSYFVVEESNGKVKLDNYSTQSLPLRVHLECSRSFSHPNLCSGGRVSSEELSEYLCIPNYYSENPITYKELPEGFEFPKSSPIKISHQQAPLQPTSCSGGGIIPENSRRVSFPDLFPEANPLLHPISTQTNTQSSMSFGELMTEEEQKAIFSDLIFQSNQWDDRSLIQVIEREDPNQTL